MTGLLGVNLLPATGEWVYDPIPHRAAQANGAGPVTVNLNAAPAGTVTDYSISIDRLQSQYPDCATVSLVVAWFGNSTDVARCEIYPSTNYIGGSSERLVDGVWSSDPWRCSGLSLSSSGLIPISETNGAASYGGTPSDPSIVRCLRDLKARGFRVVFYPFILMDCAGLPWRGRITFVGADITAAATTAILNFLGDATLAQFAVDSVNLTVNYSGPASDWTYRRMILHYASLCVLAGGVDLFLLGSEFVGLETVRGPQWTKAGAVGAAGTATWDYPFVAGLGALASDVRTIFDNAGLSRDSGNLKNLIAYSANWSNWMGVQHSDSAGQWPHLDALYAHPDIDLVSFDNYLPLSDWTTGDGGLDAANWCGSLPNQWPPSASSINGLGLTTPPSLYDKTYLKANIEGGEKFSWFYDDSTSYGRGLDPRGSDLQVSLPGSDRLQQSRSTYSAGQQLLANKQLRWWWNNPHQAIYDIGDGAGQIPRGPPSAWVPQSKSITFAEFGFPTCDRSTNQPNVFYDPRSTESATPFWSIWDASAGSAYSPRRDDLLARLALEAVIEYWTTDGKNEIGPGGILMVQPAFMSAWNWDARPFPAFPLLGVWADGVDWPAGTWIDGKGPSVAPSAPDLAPPPPSVPIFPTLSGQSFSVHYRPSFRNRIANHASGRETRAASTTLALWDIELKFDILGDGAAGDLATLVSFYASLAGAANLFTFPLPANLGAGASLVCRFNDDRVDVEEFGRQLFASGAVKIKNIRV